MNISAIRPCEPRSIGFTGKKHDYQNPIPKSKERDLTILSSIGCSALVGVTTAGVASFFITAATKYRAAKLSGIGVLTGIGTLLFSLPAVLDENKAKPSEKEKYKELIIDNTIPIDSRDQEVIDEVKELQAENQNNED